MSIAAEKVAEVMALPEQDARSTGSTADFSFWPLVSHCRKDYASNLNQEPLQMESCEPPAALNVLLWPVVSPKNRVGGSPVFSFVFAFQNIGANLATPDENGGCGYDFASGVHKYLYGADDPVDYDDPSGNDYGSLDINIAMILAPIAPLFYAGTGSPLVSGQTLNFISSLGAFAPPESVDVYVWNHSGFSVGHVMCTDYGNTQVILSQWPFKKKVGGKEGTYRPGMGYNRTQGFHDTIATEGREPDHKYTVSVPAPADFSATAAGQRAATYWNWSPTNPDETQCSTAVWLSLEAGKVPFETGQVYNANGGVLVPNTVDAWLEEDSSKTTTTGIKQDF